MKALAYHGPGKRSWEDVPHPRFDQVAEAYDLFDDPVASGALEVAVLR
ncbi:hypothetical protein [Geodermatophilus sp. SYSU D01176]